MEFRIHESIATRFPDLVIAVLDGHIEAVRSDSADILGRLRDEALERLRALFPDATQIASHPHIQCWAEAYRAMGVNPKKTAPTHEALARRLLKAKPWPSIHLLVDIYLTNQAATLLPHGGYDLESLRGDVWLTTASGGERFTALGGAEEVTVPGEVVYRDDDRILTRRWNSDDSDVTKLTSATRRFVLMIESPSSLISPPTVQFAGEELVDRLQRCLVGRFRVQMARADSVLEIQ